MADADLGDAADDVRVLSGIVFLIPAEDLHLPAFQDVDLQQRGRGQRLRAQPTPAAPARPSPAEGSRSSLLQPHSASHQCMEGPPSPSSPSLSTPLPPPWMLKCLAVSQRICLGVSRRYHSECIVNFFSYALVTVHKRNHKYAALHGRHLNGCVCVGQNVSGLKQTHIFKITVASVNSLISYFFSASQFEGPSTMLSLLVRRF